MTTKQFHNYVMRLTQHISRIVSIIIDDEEKAQWKGLSSRILEPTRSTFSSSNTLLTHTRNMMVYRFKFNENWLRYVPTTDLVPFYPIFYGDDADELGRFFLEKTGDAPADFFVLQRIRALVDACCGRPSAESPLVVPTRVQKKVKSILENVTVKDNQVTRFTPGKEQVQWSLIKRILNQWTYTVRRLQKQVVVLDHKPEDKCAICLNTAFTDPVLTPCQHAFCRPCLQWWLRGNQRRKHYSCPLCRTTITGLDRVMFSSSSS